MAVHTKLDLFQMQSLPLDAKIRMTVRRITDFIEYHDAYISISGGKDSRVLDDIESRFIGCRAADSFDDHIRTKSFCNLCQAFVYILCHGVDGVVSAYPFG